MDRTELSRPVLVTGPSFFGWDTSCILEPVRDRGIYVRLPTGDAVPLSDMTLGVNRLLRFLTLRLRDVPAQRALGVSTKKHQAGNLFRVTRGIGYGDCAALRHAEKRELLEALRLDNGLEVINPRLERGARRRPVGQAAAPLVIACDRATVPRASASTPGCAHRARHG